MSELTLYSYGFTMYPVANGPECDSIVVPVVVGTPHECLLLVPKQSTVPASLKPKSGSGGLVIPLANRVVRFAGLKGRAQCDGFGLVPDFTSLCCGVTLANQWRQKKSTGFNVVVELGPGTLAAKPDRHTTEMSWQWDGCDGERRAEQRLTSLTKYVAQWSTATIEIARLDGSGQPETITVPAGDVTLGFLSDVVDEIGDDQLTEVDLGHAVATVRLCTIDEPLSITLGKGTKDNAGPPAERLPADLIDFFRFGPRLRGRPNCGARQLPDNS